MIAIKRRRTRQALALGLALLAAPLAASAQMPVSYTEGGRALFHFEAPDFWTVRAGGPQELAGPDAEVVSETFE